jgi:hypothetical protein
MYSAIFEHTKKNQVGKISATDINGTRKASTDLDDLLQWLSYMVAFHKIKNIKVFEGHESEGNEIFVEIPKW